MGKNWNTREKFENDRGIVVRQTRTSPEGEPERRLRVTPAGMAVEDSIYISDKEELFSFTELLDDLCDAVEDGEFYVPDGF